MYGHWTIDFWILPIAIELRFGVIITRHRNRKSIWQNIHLTTISMQLLWIREPFYWFFWKSSCTFSPCSIFSANIYPKCWILHKTRVKHICMYLSQLNIRKCLFGKNFGKSIREQWHYYVIQWRILSIFVSFFDFKLMAKFYGNYELLTFFFASHKFSDQIYPLIDCYYKNEEKKTMYQFFSSFIACKLKV